MLIQYCSDLHIERFPAGTPFIQFVHPVAKVLVIAGDICPALDPLYGQFLLWCKQNWQTVVVITGNHEYFCNQNQKYTFDEIDQLIRSVCVRLGIYFLQSGQDIKLPGTNIRLVGATLWSAIDTSIWSEVSEKKGDCLQTYQRTHNSVRNTNPSDICAIHALHKAQLSSALTPKQPNETIIVVTHHMPTLKLLEDRYKTHRWRSCYASNDEDLFFPSVQAWICGHGHRALNYKIPGGPLLVMNARGYVSEVDRTTDVYNPQATLLVKI